VTDDERRSAALLFAEELALGTVDMSALDTPQVLEAVRDRPVPSWAARKLQRRLASAGNLGYEEHSVEPMVAARRAVLGAAADGPPRMLLRVGAFPHPDADADPARAGSERFAAACDVLQAHEVPFLVAVRPRETAGGDAPYRPDEEDLLLRLRDAGTAFALQGLADHPAARLDDDAVALQAIGIAPDVLVPAGERVDPRRWGALAERFDVLAGGPPTVSDLGWHPTPLWRSGAVHLPAYAPFHGAAAPMAAAVPRLAARRPALWVPLAIDWAADAPADVATLAATLAGLAHPWDEFLAAVRASRAAASS